MAQPEKSFRLGPVSASVFLNHTKDGDRPFRTATLERRYQDGDEWKSSNSFAAAEIAAAAAVLQMALHYIQEQDQKPAG